MEVIGLKMVFKTVGLDEHIHNEHSLRKGRRTEPFCVPTLRGLEKTDFANRTNKGVSNKIRGKSGQCSIAEAK